MEESQANLASRLAKNLNIAKLLCNEVNVWLGICELQSTLDEVGCSRYLSALRDIGVNTCTATPEQRVEAFIKTMLKK